MSKTVYASRHSSSDITGNTRRLIMGEVNSMIVILDHQEVNPETPPINTSKTRRTRDAAFRERYSPQFERLAGKCREDDCNNSESPGSWYMIPFLAVIVDADGNASSTLASLCSLCNFVLFGFCREPDDVIEICRSVLNCRFPADGTANDEVVLLKILELLISMVDKFRSVVPPKYLWEILRKTHQIYVQKASSYLLRSNCELIQIRLVRHIFEECSITRETTYPLQTIADDCQPSQTNCLYREKTDHDGEESSVILQASVLKYTAWLLRNGVESPVANSSTHRCPSCLDWFDSSGMDKSLQMLVESSPLSNHGYKRVLESIRMFGFALLKTILDTSVSKSRVWYAIVHNNKLMNLLKSDVYGALHEIAVSAQSTLVLSKALSLSVNLHLQFKSQLREELEIFLVDVLIRSVKTEMGCDAIYQFDHSHKLYLCLDSFVDIVADCGLIVEIFANYDCDPNSRDVFQLMIQCICSYQVSDISNSIDRWSRSPGDKTSSTGALVHSSNTPISLYSTSVNTHRNTRENKRCRQIIPLLLSRMKSNLRRLAEIGPENNVSNDDNTSNAKSIIRKSLEEKQLVKAAAIVFGKPNDNSLELQKMGIFAGPPDSDTWCLFLRANKFLDKHSIGKFISLNGSHSSAIRSRYLSSFDYASLNFVDSMRSLLLEFRLPGESQQIERIIESFSNAYFEQQCSVYEKDGSLMVGRLIPFYIDGDRPIDCTICHRSVIDSNVLYLESNITPESCLMIVDTAQERSTRKSYGALCSSPDAIFLLGYSLIMLNTDLHSPKVKNKMSLAQFIRNNSSVQGGRSLPEPFLRFCYELIRKNEMKLMEPNSNNYGVRKLGSKTHTSVSFRGVHREVEVFEYSRLIFRIIANDYLLVEDILMGSRPFEMNTPLIHGRVDDYSETINRWMNFASLASTFQENAIICSLARTAMQLFQSDLHEYSQLFLLISSLFISNFYVVFDHPTWETCLGFLFRMRVLGLLPPLSCLYKKCDVIDTSNLEATISYSFPFSRNAEPADKEPSNSSSQIGLFSFLVNSEKRKPKDEPVKSYPASDTILSLYMTEQFGYVVKYSISATAFSASKDLITMVIENLQRLQLDFKSLSSLISQHKGIDVLIRTFLDSLHKPFDELLSLNLVGSPVCSQNKVGGQNQEGESYTPLCEFRLEKRPVVRELLRQSERSWEFATEWLSVQRTSITLELTTTIILSCILSDNCHCSSEIVMDALLGVISHSIDDVHKLETASDRSHVTSSTRRYITFFGYILEECLPSFFSQSFDSWRPSTGKCYSVQFTHPLTNNTHSHPLGGTLTAPSHQSDEIQFCDIPVLLLKCLCYFSNISAKDISLYDLICQTLLIIVRSNSDVFCQTERSSAPDLCGFYKPHPHIGKLDVSSITFQREESRIVNYQNMEVGTEIKPESTEDSVGIHQNPYPRSKRGCMYEELIDISYSKFIVQFFGLLRNPDFVRSASRATYISILEIMNVILGCKKQEWNRIETLLKGFTFVLMDIAIYHRDERIAISSFETLVSLCFSGSRNTSERKLSVRDNDNTEGLNNDLPDPLITSDQRFEVGYQLHMALTFVNLSCTAKNSVVSTRAHKVVHQLFFQDNGTSRHDGIHNSETNDKETILNGVVDIDTPELPQTNSTERMNYHKTFIDAIIRGDLDLLVDHNVFISELLLKLILNNLRFWDSKYIAFVVAKVSPQGGEEARELINNIISVASDLDRDDLVVCLKEVIFP